MKTLLIVRHAKTEDAGMTTKDFDRALLPRGREHARSLASELAALHIQPTLCLASSARRARETADILCLALGIDKQHLLLRDDFYLCDESVLLSALSLLDDSHRVVMLVGHNPGISALVNYLCRDFFSSLPTTGAVLLRCPVQHWTDLHEHCTQLERSFLDRY